MPNDLDTNHHSIVQTNSKFSLLNIYGCNPKSSLKTKASKKEQKATSYSRVLFSIINKNKQKTMGQLHPPPPKKKKIMGQLQLKVRGVINQECESLHKILRKKVTEEFNSLKERY